MPEWLMTTDQYEPAGDKDAFVNKSILSFLGLLSRIRTQDGKPKDLFGVSPVFRVIFTLGLVVLISLSTQFSFVLVVLAYLLVLLCFMQARDIAAILKIGLVMTAFTFIILIPAALGGNNYSFTMIPPKVFATITAVGILSRATKWNHIITALRRFRVPNLLIFVFDITLKYIVLLGEFILEMLQALKLRSVGRNRSKVTSLGGIAGTAFIKSRLMAEEMYSAMECRGFTGDYPVYDKFRFSWADAAYLLINAGFVWLFIYLRGMA
jgi:cobalt/nickel transport system permease protein